MILDTFKISDGKIFLKDLHVERSLEACRHLNKHIKSSQLIDIYEEIENQYQNSVLSLVLNPDRLHEWQVSEKNLETLVEPITLFPVAASHLVEASAFKWADRRGWNELLKEIPPTAQDVLLINSQGEVRETSRFNIFVYDNRQNCYLTPSLQSGCVNGVFRRWLMQQGLEKGPVISSAIHMSRLKDDSLLELFVGNSVRGLLRARLASLPSANQTPV